MANLPRAFGSLGHAGERRWAEIGFVWCARQIDSGSRLFRDAGARSRGRQGITGIEQLCAPDGRACSSRASSCSRRISAARFACATCSARRRSCRGRCAARTSCNPAARAAKRISGSKAEESLSLLLEHLPGFRMVERNRLLRCCSTSGTSGTFDLKECTGRPTKAGRSSNPTGAACSCRRSCRIATRRFSLCCTPRGTSAIRQLRPRARSSRYSPEVGANLPKSGQVAWAPLFARYGDDVPRFQLIFDACEDLRVDARVQQRVPNYLRAPHATARAPGASARGAAVLRFRAGDGGGRARDCPRSTVELDARLRAPARTGGDDRRLVRIANELYDETTLAPVTDLEIYQAAYLPGRAPECGALRASRRQSRSSRSRPRPAPTATSRKARTATGENEA